MITWAPSLRNKNYRTYFYGQLVSVFGTWMQQLALGWWAYKLSGSVGWLAAVAACSQLPILFLGPWVSSLADHVERRRGVMITQVLSLLQSTALLVLYVSGYGRIEAIVGCALFLGVVNAFDIPIRQNYVAHLVPAHDLQNALAINTAAANLSRLIAPTLGGVLIALAGEGVCFAFNMISFFAILLVLYKLPGQPAMSVREEGVGALTLFVHGARHAASDFWILSSMILACVLSFFSTPYLSLMPALMKDVFKVGPELYGVAIGASGIGAMLAGLIMAARPGLMGKRAMPWLGVLGALGLVLVVSVQDAVVAMPCLILAGFGLGGSALSATAVVQSRVAPEMRGRVIGLFAMCLYGAAPLGVALMGITAQAYGIRTAMGIEAGLSIVCCLGLAACASIRIRNQVLVKTQEVTQGGMKDSMLSAAATAKVVGNVASTVVDAPVHHDFVRSKKSDEKLRFSNPLIRDTHDTNVLEKVNMCRCRCMG